MKVYDGSSTEAAPDPEPDRHKVGIADYEVTDDGAVLTTSGLGSCIGVAIRDVATGAAGLAHVMLPAADEVDAGTPVKFADTGTELLIDELAALGADPANLEAKIAGGSDMLDFSEENGSIGTRNAEVVRETLAARDVPLVGEDVGGDHGRSLRFETASGDLVVKSAKAGVTTL